MKKVVPFPNLRLRVQRDVSAEAGALVRLVRAVARGGSLAHVAEVFRGASTRAVRDKGHDALPDHGAGRALR